MKFYTVVFNFGMGGWSVKSSWRCGEGVSYFLLSVYERGRQNGWIGSGKSYQVGGKYAEQGLFRCRAEY